jgi:FixJ family two-component response regulator
MHLPGEVVYLVDDDVGIREAITDLLESVCLTVISFESAAGFLEHKRSDVAGCLVLDLQLPEITGLDLQARLCGHASLPIVFITGCGDIPSTVSAMKAGAVEFLTKPVDQEALMAAIHTALARDRANRSRRAEIAALLERYELLSPREREVLPLVVAGLLNKQAAAILGITPVTLQIHRGHIMRKMAAASFADLVRMSGALDIPASRVTTKPSIVNHLLSVSRDPGDSAE